MFHFKPINRRLFFLALLLTILGLIAVADASAPQALNIFGDKYYFVKQQIGWSIVGIIAMLIASQIPHSFWEKLAVPFFIFSVLLLLIVVLPGVGSKFLGARRWIVVGPITIQPSEVVKLAMSFYIAKLASKGRGVIAFFIPMIIVGGLIMLQPDLGTTLVVFGIWFSQVFVSGINLFYLLLALLGGGVVGGLLIFFSDYRKARLLTFIEQSSDPLGKSYHIRQVLLALGSGGLLGVGLGQSRQKFLFLPEAATDSIFAIIAEEIGFIGSIIMIGILFYFVLIGLKVAMSAGTNFAKVLGVGLSAWIAGQTLLNIGSMVALVPLTGVPLPFFSYGGSSLVMILFATGILLNIGANVNQATFRKSRRK